MRQASGRNEAMGEQQRVALLEGGQVGPPRLRRDATNHVNGARHAILLAKHYFVLESASWSASVSGVARPAVGDEPMRLLELFHRGLGHRAILSVHVERRIGASRLSAVCSHFVRTGSNMAVAAAAGANLSSTSGNSCLPTWAKMGRRSRACSSTALTVGTPVRMASLNLRGHVDEPKDDWQEADKLFHDRPSLLSVTSGRLSRRRGSNRLCFSGSFRSHRAPVHGNTVLLNGRH